MNIEDAFDVWLISHTAEGDAFIALDYFRGWYEGKQLDQVLFILTTQYDFMVRYVNKC